MEEYCLYLQVRRQCKGYYNTKFFVKILSWDWKRKFDFSIYSDFDGFLRLQRIYKNIPKNVFPGGGPFQFQIDAVRQVDILIIKSSSMTHFKVNIYKQNVDLHFQFPVYRFQVQLKL